MRLICLFFALCFTSFAQSANPILPGDHPDPTIIRIGADYWTTSTSGDWAPQFPLYRSQDLHHWTAVAAVFPQTPAWAEGSFWAPELVADHGRILLYYVARKHGGPLCVAAATAPAPQGPYTDHGPLLCQPDGSIDPAFIRDEHGQPFLLWKEDGNSRRQPTPIFAQPLTPDLLHLTGTKTQLITNDPASWEGGVVEAPYILRHGGLFYLFYAGNACCGTECHYAEGVARASHLLGPWEKDTANPIIRPNGNWKCPGHGTAVETPSGDAYFLYHAYPTAGTTYLGRESVLDHIAWSKDGWPIVNNAAGPGGELARSQPQSFTDTFQQTSLDPEWKWPLRLAPQARGGGGQLIFTLQDGKRPALLARTLFGSDYEATVMLEPSTASAGLAIVGGSRSRIVLLRDASSLVLERQQNGSSQVLWQHPASPGPMTLRVHSSSLKDLTFSYSMDGTSFAPAGDSLDASSLIPWDQGLRVGLFARGDPGSKASFRRFSMHTTQ